ncbi:hypothetical protein [Ovoidimarina sediminis]|nr:hypothetical protein [Rhodophyticola sp. MJ-SS7]MDU8946061.1 hypothetical protein [Rhodophyticola sp. MJ-SS7]
MTRALFACLLAACLAGCGADGAPEPFDSGAPAPEPSIRITEGINVEGVL